MGNLFHQLIKTNTPFCGFFKENIKLKYTREKAKKQKGWSTARWCHTVGVEDLDDKGVLSLEEDSWLVL